MDRKELAVELHHKGFNCAQAVEMCIRDRYITIEKIAPLHLQRKGERMKKLMDSMRVSVLFEGIKETELESLVENGGVRVQAFQKDQFLIRQGDKAKGVGLVLEGRLHILRCLLYTSRCV